MSHRRAGGGWCLQWGWPHSPCLSSQSCPRAPCPKTCRRLRAPEKPHSKDPLMSFQHNRALRKQAARDQLIPAKKKKHKKRNENLSSAQNIKTWAAERTQVKEGWALPRAWQDMGGVGL